MEHEQWVEFAYRFPILGEARLPVNDDVLTLREMIDQKVQLADLIATNKRRTIASGLGAVVPCDSIS